MDVIDLSNLSDEEDSVLNVPDDDDIVVVEPSGDARSSTSTRRTKAARKASTSTKPSVEKRVATPHPVPAPATSDTSERTETRDQQQLVVAIFEIARLRAVNKQLEEKKEAVEREKASLKQERDEVIATINALRMEARELGRCLDELLSCQVCFMPMKSAYTYAATQ
ncbi:unnamed protein product [Peniophora sp. CBMAI 1063]|nr:unnamed protein product [Peniophora sp. CBMAI 1063]